VVAAGGDGTVDDVINRFPGLPMTVCPLGTENLFAKYIGMQRDGRFVADAIAAGRTRRLDLCMLNDAQRFVIMASFGFDADVVHRTHARRRGYISKLSYVRPILESFTRYRYPPLQVFADGASEPQTGSLAIVSNMPMYAMQLPFAKMALPDDGLLDVRIFERPGRGQLLRYSWSLVRSRHEGLPHVRSLRATRIRVESAVPVPVQVDGDPAGFTPVEIRVLPAELTVIVP
jgi:diacylglycerol kinase family enzyme